MGISLQMNLFFVRFLMHTIKGVVCGDKALVATLTCVLSIKKPYVLCTTVFCYIQFIFSCSMFPFSS